MKRSPLKPGKPMQRKAPVRKRRRGTRAQAKRKCDTLHSQCVRARDKGRCVVCGSPNGQCHHLIGRTVVFFRHNIENGVTLCPKHHTFDSKLSAHGAPWAFEEWMREHRPEQYAWWEKNRREIILGVKVDYSQIEAILKDELAKLKGNDDECRSDD